MPPTATRQEPFGERLLDHARASCAQCNSRREFLLPRDAPGEHEVGDVDRRDDEHKHHAGEQHEQRRADGANGLLEHRQHGCAPAFVGIRVRLRELRRHR